MSITKEQARYLISLCECEKAVLRRVAASQGVDFLDGIISALMPAVTPTEEPIAEIRWCEENEAYFDRRSEELRLAGEETKGAEAERNARIYGIRAMTLREEAGLDPFGPPL
jgi:hypothetical protein